MTTKILLRDLTLSCIIGTDAAEAHIRQQLLLDADITLQHTPADDTTPSYNYHSAVVALRQLAETPCGLMETFAQNAAACLLNLNPNLNPNAQNTQKTNTTPAAGEVRVYVRKPRVFADLASAGVEVIIKNPS